MKIYVGGINAVGKSSIAKEAADRLGYRYVHATTGLLEHLGFGKDYEKLRALTQQERDAAYREFIESLFKNEEDSFLLDGHYLGLVRGEIDCITDDWIKNFDMFVLIHAPIEDVWKRLVADSATRDRALFADGLFSEENKIFLKDYQDQTEKEFEKLMGLYEKNGVKILNEEGKKDGAVDVLVGFVRT